ncbi:MAG: alpha/beta hydrolase [Bulleidia sp.]|nr:alpha/beta hydrolase [Bulleidia sp.]
MKKGFRMIGRILLIAVIAIAVTIFAVIQLGAYRNANYWKSAKPAGEIEAKYTALGSHAAEHLELDAGDDVCKKYTVYYPSDMKDGETYPLVVMVNGTGIKASSYKEVLKHLSSWGFIVFGNEDDNSWSGASTSKTLDDALAQNENTESPLYHRIDTDHIGVGGHSQGGVGTINAVTAQENGSMYKAMWTASTTFHDLSVLLQWPYDVSKVSIPYMMVAGTNASDAGDGKDNAGIAPLSSLNENFDAIPDGVPKVMAREKNMDHGDMLRFADGYMTAWFMYWLQGDEEAGKAFFGDSAEILTNPNWQDVRVSR